MNLSNGHEGKDFEKMGTLIHRSRCTVQGAKNWFVKTHHNFVDH